MQDSVSGSQSSWATNCWSLGVYSAEAVVRALSVLALFLSAPLFGHGVETGYWVGWAFGLTKFLRFYFLSGQVNNKNE